jgi:hypothetical protein
MKCLYVWVKGKKKPACRWDDKPVLVHLHDAFNASTPYRLPVAESDGGGALKMTS